MKNYSRLLPLVSFASDLFCCRPDCLRRTGCTPAPTWAMIAFALPRPISSRLATIPRAGVKDGLRRHTLQRPGECGHLRPGLEEHGAAGTPGSPQEIHLAQWSAAPANAAMVAFGALSAGNGRLTVYGWLYDTSNTASPQVLGKQYNEDASQDMARTIAHRFADEIILRLGRRHQRHCRNQDLLRQLAHRIERDLGDGLRRAESAPDHPPGQHLALASHFAGQFAAGLFFAGQRGLVHPHVLAGSQTAGGLFRRHGRREATSRRPGLRTAPRLRSRRRGRAIRRYGLRCKRRQSAPGHHLPRAGRFAHLESAHQCADCVGERAHRACRRFTSWIRTAPTFSA